MAQELTVREVFDGGAWTIDVTRDDFNGVTRGYIVGAWNDMRITTLHTVGVSRDWPAAVAFAECLAYARETAERARATGELPAGYRPTNYRFYSERITA